ncbi:PREDICTED: uncharacterized protein LOC104813611 [Tarenaya hassleriana]|uniref:uncharacterized protein LOC104813611 n=1 Tax=Tarenaya hassleriana TaxID=28532 RepID=UPI00053C8750|nr:PREDICTED: uncharacterized protein LOC104813611 [Tarenaya hassleriana]
MAADVSSIVRILSGYKDEGAVVNDSAGAKSTVAVMTRDLLGGAGDQSLELDLDLQVPTGWEKRLDLKSGKVYLTRCNSTSSSSSTHTDRSNHTATTKFQDLNFPPISGNFPVKQPLLDLFNDTSLQLKLVPSSSSLSTASSFQSVCTLDKVKSALERAEKDQKSTMMIKKRQSPSAESDDSSVIAFASESDSKSASPVAAGCPNCLSYVLVMKNNPKCPRCNSFLPLSEIKKPKIDLNISI